MKKQLIIIGITLVLITVGLSGCDDDDEAGVIEGEYGRFYGTWNTDIPDNKFWNFESSKELLVEFSDGTTHNSGKFKLFNKQLFLFDSTVCYTYEFSVNDRALTLTVDGDDLGHPTYIVLTKYVTAPERPNFEIISQEASDNFATVSEGGYTGTVWVNVTIKNTGADGLQSIYAEVYQGIGNFTNCGIGYNSNNVQQTYLAKGESTTLTFTFVGVENHNNTGCYGVRCQRYGG
jgi:hypothetical protein